MIVWYYTSPKNLDRFQPIKILCVTSGTFVLDVPCPVALSFRVAGDHFATLHSGHLTSAYLVRFGALALPYCSHG